MENMNHMMMDMARMNMQISFHWGNEKTILFHGWPNQNTGMYTLALFFVFVIAFAKEALYVWPTVKPNTNPVLAGFTQASVYSVRVSLGYLVMLSVMSFNVGVFIAAVAGHSFGYFVVQASAFALAKPSQPDDH